MFREKIPYPQLTAWLFAGMTPVLIQLFSGSPWTWVAIAGIIGVVLTMLVWRSGWQPSKWQCPLIFIYIVVFVGQLLSSAAQSWPKGDATAVPLILLLVAAWSAQKGPSAAARTGAVLFWAVLILYLAVFAAGLGDITCSWLLPRWELPDGYGLAVLLVPSFAVCLLGTGRKSVARLSLPVLFPVVGALITAGALSPEVASSLGNPFYEMTRSISLLGVARRFEALISAAMTVGWFALMSMLLTVCGVLTQKIFPGRGRSGVWLAAAAAAGVLLCGLHIPAIFMTLVGAVFWVVVPLITQGLVSEKKS